MNKSFSNGISKYSDNDVSMTSWKFPSGYDVQDVCDKITHGDGWVILKGMFDEKGVEMAKERIFLHKFGGSSPTEKLA